MVTLPASPLPACPSFAASRSAVRQTDETATPSPEGPHGANPPSAADWLSAAMAAWLVPSGNELPATPQASDR